MTGGFCPPRVTRGSRNSRPCRWRPVTGAPGEKGASGPHALPCRPACPAVPAGHAGRAEQALLHLAVDTSGTAADTQGKSQVMTGWPGMPGTQAGAAGGFRDRGQFAAISAVKYPRSWGAVRRGAACPVCRAGHGGGAGPAVLRNGCCEMQVFAYAILSSVNDIRNSEVAALGLMTRARRRDTALGVTGLLPL